jgi:dTDP-4-dehydrorhamnose reductase
MIKILLLGAKGQVGWALQRSLSALGHLIALGHKEAPLEQGAALQRLIENTGPDYVVNAAAYTQVDQAESDPEMAYQINDEALGYIAQGCQKTGAWLIHYSTDYVFDGKKIGLYTEEDSTNPQNIYGKSKREGEKKILTTHNQSLIFRTSWVYSLGGKNFLKTILLKALQAFQNPQGPNDHHLKIICDQWGAPTGAGLIADVTAQIIHFLKLQSFLKTDKVLNNLHQPHSLPIGIQGIYHLCASGKTNWYAYAQHILDFWSEKDPSFKNFLRNFPLSPLESKQASFKAHRPENSCLSSEKLRQTFGLHLPCWTQGVDHVLEELWYTRGLWQSFLGPQ